MPACRAKYKHTTSSMCTTRTMHRAQPAVYRKHHARLVKCQPTVGGRTVGMSTRQQNNPATAQQATHQAWPHNYCLKYTSLAAGARMHASRNTQHAACSTDTPTAARAATVGIQTPQICTARGDGDEAQSAQTATEVRQHNPRCHAGGHSDEERRRGTRTRRCTPWFRVGRREKPRKTKAGEDTVLAVEAAALLAAG
jgi:hypothetical protein